MASDLTYAALLVLASLAVLLDLLGVLILASAWRVWRRQLAIMRLLEEHGATHDRLAQGLVELRRVVSMREA